MTIRALGIDQGIANCGYALIDITIENDEINKRKEEVEYTIETIDSGVIETESRLEMANRAFDIYDKINELMKKHKPDIMGCEQLFLNNNQRSVGMLYVNMATGILYALAGKYKVPIEEFVPGTVKKTITGHGQASKEDVIGEITSQLKDDNQSDFVNNEHIADAFGIALTSGLEFFKNEEHYIDIKDSMINKYTTPDKRKPIKLMKSEKTKLDKMKDISKFKNLDPLDISKETGVPKNTVEKYLIEMDEGEFERLLQKEKDYKEGKLDKFK